jgi:Ca2+-binding EF-hand superfamily protein
MKAGQVVFAAVLIGFASTTSAAVTQTQQDERQTDLRQRQAEFREMDRDNDGVITRAEWRGSQESFRNYDLNRDGVLSGNEIWVGRGRGWTRNRQGERERPAFADLDRNENGVITSGEWRGTTEEFRALDTDGDGVISPREYREARDVATSPAYRAGHDRGVIDGRQAGKEDKTINGGRWDLDGQRELETADAGYTENVGPRADYQAGYRVGFRAGYREGFGPR